MLLLEMATFPGGITGVGALWFPVVIALLVASVIASIISLIGTLVIAAFVGSCPGRLVGHCRSRRHHCADGKCQSIFHKGFHVEPPESG
ncbi:MAG: hypothetical protein Q8N33_13530 [Rhodocyclaceae bacterium]|nr:hypothetical protein [Rhodocyclaceae bacterium]